MSRTARTRFGSTARSVVIMALLAASITLVAPGNTAGANPAGTGLVISQVYGGGGNSGAQYTNDFIEIFNPTSSPVSLAGMSVQYASATGSGNFGANSGQITELGGTLGGGEYLLIEEAAGSGGTTALPTPDITDSTPISMSGTSGKVVLVATTTSLGCNGGSTPCSPSQLAQIIDLVGYGSANFSEGAAAPGLSNTTAAFRANDGCTDTDDNSADFSAAAPQPRNTASPTTACGGGAPDPVINEFVANHTGTDTEAFVEVRGTPSTDYSGFTVLEIEGDGSGGVVDAVLAVGTTNAGGYWTDDEDMENGTLSILLVEDFTGSLGADLDADDDGVFDVTPWTRIVDTVAVHDGDPGDVTYSTTVLDPFYDGAPFTPGGASRIPDGTDTDTTADWTRNDFDGFGFPGFSGSPAVGEAENTPGAVNNVITIATDPLGECFDPATAIHDIQGSGFGSTDVGSIREIEGVVVGDFQDGVGENGDLNGFYLQEEDGQHDGDPATSEGIFVFEGFGTPSEDVAIGDVVRVRGTVGEFVTSGGASSQTQITGSPTVLDCGTTATVTPTDVEFPLVAVDELENYEGMLIRLPQELVISEYFNYDRFNEVVVALPPNGWDRLVTPTAVVEPGPDAVALAAEYALRRITIDDGRSNQNPLPAIHPGNGLEFTEANSFRGGDTIAGTIGVVDHTFGLYRVQPTAHGTHTSTNARTAAPDEVGGSLEVASFNVLNYFHTVDGAGPICGPGKNQGCRGADSESERLRQLDKIVAAMDAIDADVFGIIEVENTTGVEAMADIVDGLNAAGGTYDYVDTGTIGSDAIKVGFIYDTSTVTPSGAHAILDATVDARFNDDKNRPVLAQTFVESSSGAAVTVAVNHLKSKGSPCDDVGDPDAGLGAGNCNVTRTLAAEALVDWLAADPTGSGDADVLIVGDLNSYDKEDPIDALVTGDYTDLLAAFGGELAYSYVFDGQTGYLDYALSNSALTSQVTGVTAWHINADEPDIWDYDESFNDPSFYVADPFRSSDHDPVIVGLDLNGPPVCSAATPSIASISRPNHKMVDVTVLGVTDPDGDDVTITIDSIFQDEPVNGDDDGDTAPDGAGIGTSTAQVRAERSGVADGRVYHIGFTATDTSGNTCSGSVTVAVPLSRNGAAAVDGGALYDSTLS